MLPLAGSQSTSWNTAPRIIEKRKTLVMPLSPEKIERWRGSDIKGVLQPRIAQPTNTNPPYYQPDIEDCRERGSERPRSATFCFYVRGAIKDWCRITKYGKERSEI